MKEVGVVRFPGSNCDRDVVQMVESKGFKATYLWHLDRFDTKKFEALILPGGFSYGDYLRAGALAARSPVMNSVKEFASFGGPVLGICNGFQILVESQLLPGALVKNKNLRFIDDWVELRVIEKRGYWSRNIERETLRLPIAHGEGRFYLDSDGLKRIHDEKQVWLKYRENPNGALEDIAGVLNPQGNVAGLMPHPERAIFDWMGSNDGWGFL